MTFRAALSICGLVAPALAAAMPVNWARRTVYTGFISSVGRPHTHGAGSYRSSSPATRSQSPWSRTPRFIFRSVALRGA